MNEFDFGNVGDVPDVHPYLDPEFFGDAMMVNGHTWPYVDVDRGQYRLTILNGCNARFLHLSFDNGMSFVGDRLRRRLPAVAGPRDQPVRHTGLAHGHIGRLPRTSPRARRWSLRDDANAPFPGGTPPDPNTVGQIMQFRVGSKMGFKPKTLPAQLNPTLAGPDWPALRPGGLKRILTLNELLDTRPPNNSLGLFLNGQMWDGMVSETPKNGTTEDWYFVNMTGDAHPMHLHLVQFNIVSRQDFNVTKYTTDWFKLNQAGLTNGKLPFKSTWQTKVLPFEPYLTPGTRTLAEPDEHGWRRAWSAPCRAR